MENEPPTKERSRKDDWTTDNKTRTIIHRVGIPFQRDARLKHTWGKRKNDSKKYDLPGPSFSVTRRSGMPSHIPT